MNRKSSFTLTELIIVVALVGLVAAFGIPTYTKAVSRAKEKDANYNLEMIREAVRLFITREGGATPPDLADAATINTTLYLSVITQQGNTYSCEAANLYTCEASNSDGWDIEFRLDTDNGDIYCSNGSCPTIKP